MSAMVIYVPQCLHECISKAITSHLLLADDSQIPPVAHVQYGLLNAKSNLPHETMPAAGSVYHAVQVFLLRG